jgi:L-seryl-tRNA(Ser) seleniumtransferase
MSKTILPGPGESRQDNKALHLPSVDRLLGCEPIAAVSARLGRVVVKRAITQVLAMYRQQKRQPSSEDALVAEICEAAHCDARPRLRKVINLTGTVIHTNLGRAVLADEVIESISAAMRGYGALEFDIESGERGDRDAIVEELLCRLTGAQSATVVNNCAAAVLLSLVALGARKEVLISRGEQIEIGGAFRMPDIMRAANCRLVEVGTTNRTHLRDFEEAITDKSALIVKAHRSNYAVTGFTAEVGDEALAQLAHAHGLMYMVDLGSGALIDMSQFGLAREPLPSDSLSRGADVVMFSGDKLLGGPQAGIIVGSKEAIAKIKKHPLKRALRVSKLVLSALEATLRIYDSGQKLDERIPALWMLTRPQGDIRSACERIAPVLASIAGPQYTADIVDCASQIGSGALPEETLPSAAVRLQFTASERRSGKLLEASLAKFRALKVPVIGRIKENALLFDARCLLPEDEKLLLELRQ